MRTFPLSLLFAVLISTVNFQFDVFAKVRCTQLSLTTQAPFPNFGTSFRMIKASNVIASVVPVKLTDVRTSLTDMAPIIEKIFLRLLGFGQKSREPFKDLAYNLTIAKLDPDSSINIKSFKQTYRIFCQNNSYRRLKTLSVPFALGKSVFF